MEEYILGDGIDDGVQNNEGSMFKEMAYPQQFDFDRMLQYRTFPARIEYVASMLEKLGSGSSRTAYKVDDYKVIKIAKNNKGIAQNEAEANIGWSNYVCCAEVFETDRAGIFLEMELVRAFNNTSQERTLEPLSAWLGTDLKVLLDTLRIPQRMRPQGVNDPWFAFRQGLTGKHDPESELRKDWLSSLFSLIVDQEAIVADIAMLSHWGWVVRDYEGRDMKIPVLLDFGYTRPVYNNHYN